MSDEPKIQHTDALQLCNQLTSLQHSVSSLQHELVLHYSATGVPSHKTKGRVESLSRELERTEEQLEIIRNELEELGR